jgi:prepilin-type processing-associated H-X9-DG protein
MCRRLAAAAATCVALFLVPMVALGQPLSDRVPADAIIYVGWNGTSNLGASYDQSRFKALLDDSNIPELFNDLVPRVIQRVAIEDQQAAAVLQKISDVAGPVWRHPTAFYFAGLEFPKGGQGEPRPKAALLCKPGDDAEAMLTQLAALAGEAQQGAPFPVKAFRQGDIVGISIGFERETDAFAGAGGNAAGGGNISAKDRFKEAIGQVQKEPLLVAYADVEALVAMVDQGMKTYESPEHQQQYAKVKDALGLNGLKRIIMTGGFEGQDWTTQAFVAAPAPRSGLLKMLDAKPVSDELLRAIPKTAAWVGVGQFDFAQLLTEARAAAAKIDPQAPRMFDQGMGAAQMMLAMNPQRDLFEPLGPEWAFYLDQNIGGNGLIGFTIINRLRKPAEAERALTRLEFTISNLVNGQIGREGMTLNVEQVEINGTKIHFFSTPLVSPSWAIRDGNLYVGMFPQVVSAAAQHAAAKQPSILDNEAFVALRKRLGGEKATGFSFMDLPRTAGEGYQTLLLISQAGLGAAEMFGIDTPPMVIPPLATLKQHLSPAAGFSWTDDAGLHFKSASPFPGAELVMSQGGVVMAAPALLAGVAMPAVSRAREQAGRVQSMSNLRQIGLAMHMYANENRGRYPADLGTLALMDLNPVVFVSPMGGKTVPQNVVQGNAEQQKAWINQNADYVYLGAGRGVNDPDTAGTIVAYEKPETTRGQGTNILFADGHVEWLPVPMAMERIRRQQEQKGKAAPPAKAF